jgi:hypothetical protein
MHASDADLQAWRDGELDIDASPALARHLRECVECRARADELGRLSEATAELLTGLDRRHAPTPRTLPLAAIRVERMRRQGRRRALLAASVALLAATGVAAAVPNSPLHRLLERLTGTAATAPAEPRVVPHATATAADRKARREGISYVPGDELVVRLVPRPVSGTVTVSIASGDALRAVGQGGRLGYRVSTDTLTLSAAAPVQQYEIVVPSRLRRFQLLAGQKLLLDRRSPAISGFPDTATYHFDLESP